MSHHPSDHEHCDDHDHHHHHHHHHDRPDPDHRPHERVVTHSSGLSAREKLVIHLQHLIRHNQDHLATYLNLAAAARELNLNEAAHWIEHAMEDAARQNQQVEKALSVVQAGH
jgi:hypothetical protein